MHVGGEMMGKTMESPPLQHYQTVVQKGLQPLHLQQVDQSQEYKPIGLLTID